MTVEAARGVAEVVARAAVTVDMAEVVALALAAAAIGRDRQFHMCALLELCPRSARRAALLGSHKSASGGHECATWMGGPIKSTMSLYNSAAILFQTIYENTASRFEFSFINSFQLCLVPVVVYPP